MCAFQCSAHDIRRLHSLEPYVANSDGAHEEKWQGAVVAGGTQRVEMGGNFPWIFMMCVLCDTNPVFARCAQLVLLGLSCAASGLLMMWALDKVDPNGPAKKAVSKIAIKPFSSAVFSSSGRV